MDPSNEQFDFITIENDANKRRINSRDSFPV